MLDRVNVVAHNGEVLCITKYYEIKDSGRGYIVVKLQAERRTEEPAGRERTTRTVVLAAVTGFCFGVRRAIDMANQEREAVPGRVTTLGPLVHNSQVSERLRGQGIDGADTLDQVPGGTVVLSAHGSSPIVLRQAKERGLRVVDATCPFVTKLHRAAAMLVSQGYTLVIVGDAGHSEMKGVLGAVAEAGGTAHLVSSPAEAARLRLGKKVGIVSQTTQRADTFGAVVAAVCIRTPDVRAFNTVCSATEELQDAAVALAGKVDVVLVIGGRNSANTRRLRELCEEAGTPAHHIETAADVDAAWLENASRIGITAGASTPDWLVEEVARAVNEGSLPDDWKVRHPDE